MQKNNRILVAVAILFYGCIIVFHLASAKAGYSHYRDIHLGTAIEYAKGKVDLLRPIIVGFNATQTPTPQELPLWQALAGFGFKLCGPWFGWANLLSLLLFAAGIWPFYRLAEKYTQRRAAWWAVIFLLTQPIIILISGQASADGLSFAFALWFLFFADKLIENGHAVWLVPAILFGSFSAVTKLPLFMSVGLTSCLLLMGRAPRSAKRWLLLMAAGGVSGLLFFAWTRYTDSCLAQAEFPYVDLSLSRNPDMWRWYFGDWHYRLSPFNWGKGGWAALNCLFGSFALVALAAWALFFSSNKLAKAWLIAALVTTLIFSHLVLVHRHYFILYSPAIAMLCAAGVVRLESLLNLRVPWQRTLTATGLCAVLLLSAVQGLIGIKIVLDYDPYPQLMARTIDQYTTPADKLLIAGGGWGGEMLILSHRRGLTIDNTKMLEDTQALQRLLALGYTKLVMISDSPLLHALEMIDPGALNKKRPTYEENVTTVAEPWPILFQSPDILIKDLPRQAP